MMMKNNNKLLILIKRSKSKIQKHMMIMNSMEMKIIKMINISHNLININNYTKKIKILLTIYH